MLRNGIFGSKREVGRGGWRKCDTENSQRHTMFWWRRVWKCLLECDCRVDCSMCTDDSKEPALSVIRAQKIWSLKSQPWLPWRQVPQKRPYMYNRLHDVNNFETWLCLWGRLYWAFCEALSCAVAFVRGCNTIRGSGRGKFSGKCTCLCLGGLGVVCAFTWQPMACLQKESVLNPGVLG
jgi:hypothetical protein